MTQIVKITENESIDFFNEENETYLAIKPACEILKVDHSRQFQNIKKDEFLFPTMALRATVAKDGKEREMVHLPLMHFFWWLLNIDANKVKPGNKEELKLKQWLIYEKVYNSLSDRIKLYKAKDKAISEKRSQLQKFETQKAELDKKIKAGKKELQELTLAPPENFIQLSLFTDEEQGKLPAA